MECTHDVEESSGNESCNGECLGDSQRTCANPPDTPPAPAEAQQTRIPRMDFPTTAIVRLNVGGDMFQVSRSNLLCRQSVFTAMERGEFAIESDDDGRLWFDRDGKLFRFVLQYLRDGRVILPDAFQEQNLLANEFKFYGLDGVAIPPGPGERFVSIAYNTLKSFVEEFVDHFTPFIEERLHRGQVAFRLFVVANETPPGASLLPMPTTQVDAGRQINEKDTVINEDWFKSICEFGSEWQMLLKKNLLVDVHLEGKTSCRVFSFTFKHAVMERVKELTQ